MKAGLFNDDQHDHVHRGDSPELPTLALVVRRIGRKAKLMDTRLGDPRVAEALQELVGKKLRWFVDNRKGEVMRVEATKNCPIIHIEGWDGPMTSSVFADWQVDGRWFVEGEPAAQQF